jgi:hypothetical protein
MSTFFEQVTTSYASVPVTGADKRIATKEFLLATEDLVKLFGKLVSATPY